MVMPGKLHREVTSEPVRALHNDGAHAVAGDASSIAVNPGRSVTASEPFTESS
jgi:hypothetical protein